eukprot:GHVT01041741.1.p1 GENE.GHVT01041741.1~~GHVT01041741.1.p1  ORF type:complete len:136 (+),score=34.23 GHVT01041741.1:1626-2033(+)
MGGASARRPLSLRPGPANVSSAAAASSGAGSSAAAGSSSAPSSVASSSGSKAPAPHAATPPRPSNSGRLPRRAEATTNLFIFGFSANGGTNAKEMPEEMRKEMKAKNGEAKQGGRKRKTQDRRHSNTCTHRHRPL